MDNKKYYKRFATIFWWAFTILPLFVFLIYFIGYHFTFNSGINSASELTLYHSNGFDIASILSDSIQNFTDFVPSAFNSAFVNIFNVLNISELAYAYLLAYMFWIQIIHLIFDVFIWLPNFFHKILDKGEK